MLIKWSKILLQSVVNHPVETTHFTFTDSQIQYVRQHKNFQQPTKEYLSYLRGVNIASHPSYRYNQFNQQRFDQPFPLLTIRVYSLISNDLSFLARFSTDFFFRKPDFPSTETVLIEHNNQTYPFNFTLFFHVMDQFILTISP